MFSKNIPQYQAIVIHPFEQMLGVKKNEDQNICSCDLLHLQITHYLVCKFLNI